MTWTTIGLSLICALLLKYWKNLSYPKYLPTSTLTIFTILVNQHIVQVTALKQLFWKLLMICSFLLAISVNITVLALLDFSSAFAQLIILSLYTVSILPLDLLIQSFNGFLLIWLIVHTTSLYLMIVLLLLLYTHVFLSVQFLALFFSPCMLGLCLPLSTLTLSYTMHLLMTHNYRCQLPHHITLCSLYIYTSMFGQLRTCLNLMSTRQNSCLSPLRELSISITYLLQSLSAMLNFPSNTLWRIWILN